MSSYPAAFDFLATALTNSDPCEDTHPALHNDANSAINAIEEVLGISPQGSRATVKERLESIEAAIELTEGVLPGNLALLDEEGQLLAGELPHGVITSEAGANQIYADAYGCKGDGKTDDTEKMQEALDAAAAFGGTLSLTAGKEYNCGTLTLTSKSGFRITSTGGKARGHSGSKNATLNFTGTIGNLLELRSCVNFEIDHIRFKYNSETFVGTEAYLLNLNGTSGDVQNFDIHHCAFGDDVTSGEGCTALIRTYKAIIGEIRSNSFGYAQRAIYADTPYLNVVSISKNSFNFAKKAYIEINAGDCESLTIRENTFENRPAEGPAISGGPKNAFYSCTIVGNWFGDNTRSDSIPWIGELAGVSYRISMVIGNKFTVKNEEGFHLQLGGQWLVMGNSFENGRGIKKGANSGIVSIMNNYTGEAIFDNQPATWLSIADKGQEVPVTGKGGVNIWGGKSTEPLWNLLWNGGVKSNVNEVAAAGEAQTLPDITTASMHWLKLTAAECKLVFPSAEPGKRFQLALEQDSTGGRKIKSWPVTVLWAGGSVPSLTSTKEKTDILEFVCFHSKWLGRVVAQNF